MNDRFALILASALASAAVWAGLLAAWVLLDRAVAPRLLQQRRHRLARRAATAFGIDSPQYQAEVSRLDALYTDTPSSPPEIARHFIRALRHNIPLLIAVSVGVPLLRWLAR